MRRHRSVWALIFNFKSEKETIYAQQMGEDGQEYVITWQEQEDAVRYGDMLADAHGYPGGTAVEVFTSWTNLGSAEPAHAQSDQNHI